MNNFTEYAALIKPTWSPPSWLFGPVWTVLYVGIALSFGRVFFLACLLKGFNGIAKNIHKHLIDLARKTLNGREFFKVLVYFDSVF